MIEWPPPLRCQFGPRLQMAPTRAPLSQLAAAAVRGAAPTSAARAPAVRVQRGAALRALARG
eukprot:scaffold163956_cov27-Tisochrysis_lutea.AAC.1